VREKEGRGGEEAGGRVLMLASLEIMALSSSAC